jgi:hypothetical protein
MRGLIACLAVMAAACSAASTVTTVGGSVTEEQVREQIHAATGHDPEACTTMAGEIASIAIDEALAIPECIIVQEGARLVVANQTGVDQRFAISDPPGVNGRHDIYVLEIPSGAEDSIPEVGERTNSGVYPFYIRGGEPFSGFLVVVP